LISNKGKQGGFSVELDKIDKIKLIEIVLATDGPDILTRCAFGLEKCTSEKPCPFHDKFKGIREELRDSLSEISVYDMALKTEQGIAFLKN
jgi:DNA-binding IscR family transcriptional regulator